MEVVTHALSDGLVHSFPVLNESVNPWLPNHPPVITPDNKIPGTSCSIGQKLISEAYDSPPPFMHGSPFEDGVMVISLVPWGCIGEYWFLEDQPDMIYAIPYGVVLTVGRPVVLEHIKNLAKREHS